MEFMRGAADVGILLARDGRFEDALRVFDEDLSFAQHPTAMSFYAVCLAAVEGDYEKAISLGLLAAEKEFYNPEVYLNLGKIFLLRGQKSVAIKAFRKGLRIDDTHSALKEEIRRLGQRRRPVVPFLPRQNMLNKLLGMLAVKVG
jgi:tetratricopeptide (TPR) repeat protein